MSIVTARVPFQSDVWFLPDELTRLAELGAVDYEHEHSVNIHRPARRMKIVDNGDGLCAVFEFVSHV